MGHELISSQMADRLSTRAFREFAPEIREMIYSYALRPVDVHDGIESKTPALLVALRGELDLYNEALHHFYSNNETYVREGNFKKFEDLSPTTWRSIRHLKFSCRRL